jgi:hypothetical protein
MKAKHEADYALSNSCTKPTERLARERPSSTRLLRHSETRTAAPETAIEEWKDAARQLGASSWPRGDRPMATAFSRIVA